MVRQGKNYFLRIQPLNQGCFLYTDMSYRWQNTVYNSSKNGYSYAKFYQQEL